MSIDRTLDNFFFLSSPSSDALLRGVRRLGVQVQLEDGGPNVCGDRWTWLAFCQVRSL